MITDKYKETEEARLFKHFSDHFLVDILDSGLVSRTPSGEGSLRRFIAYYDPAHSDYVTRCETWQIAMCQQTVPGDWDRLCSFPTGVLEDLGVLERDRHFDWSLRNADPWLMKALHQVVRCFFKLRSKPRNETDLEAVKFRLSRPTLSCQAGEYHDTLSLSTQEIRAARDFVKYLVAPRSWDDLRGRYGPGVSSDARDEWEKQFLAPQKLEPELLNLYHLAHYDWCVRTKGRTRYIGHYRYGITKIAEVPKSLKGNRIVSSEPANSMFAELAVGDELAGMLNRIYPEHVSLDDQLKHNSLLKRDGYTSIDLSDASDHVSRRLVAMILPQWKTWLFSVRSTFAKFPDGTLCPLRTFAPMGSGVCFPVLTAIVLALCGSCARRPFHVYGDDIICHVSDYHVIVDRLTRAGLVVNAQKSCPTGIYKESCGMEILHGIDVTPMLMRDPVRNVDTLTLETYLTKLDNAWPGFRFWESTKVAMVEIWQQTHNLRLPFWYRKTQNMVADVPVWKTRKVKVRAPGGEAALRRWLTSVTDDRNERPDTPETWDLGAPRPRLYSWQQSIHGSSSEDGRHNQWEEVVMKNRSRCALKVETTQCYLFPTVWKLWLEITNFNIQSSKQEVL